jgi:hypothetical protein
MAYNADNEVREELATIQKNSRGDFVIVSKVTNKNSGNSSIDIRQYYTNDADEVKPTSKGVRFSTEELLEIMTGLVNALEPDEVDDLAGILAEKLGEDGSDEEEGSEE